MITIEDLKSIIQTPQFEPLKFNIPDSITGLKREAVFLGLNYFTAENQPTAIKEHTAFLEISFEVRGFQLNIITPEPKQVYNLEKEEYETLEEEPYTQKVEFPTMRQVQTFTADYRTYVNAVTGEVITSPKNFAEDKQGLVDYLNNLVTDGIYTEEELKSGNISNLMITNQIKYFEMLFNNEEYNGMIPVKQLIQSFALNANWKDAEVLK